MPAMDKHFSDRRDSPEPSKVKSPEEVTQEGTGTDVQILLPASVLSKLPHHNCILKIFMMHGRKLALMKHQLKSSDLTLLNT